MLFDVSSKRIEGMFDRRQVLIGIAESVIGNPSMMARCISH